jgi:ubiquinone/menaquinone biosynthesis C-methylase UbiE
MSRSVDDVRQYYIERERSGAESGNTPFARGYLYTIQAVERDLLALLHETGLDNLASMTLLDVGCGTGAWMRRFAVYGLPPAHQTGVDLLPERAAVAAELSPGANIAVANAERLPFGCERFDLVTQFVMLSSLREQQARRRAAREMIRVLKPRGAIISYDFIFNPLNRRTRGLRQREYRELFPGCSVHFHRVTLAPPVARRIANFSWILGELVEKVVFVRTHYLVVVRKS